jgi:hypothetical protein
MGADFEEIRELFVDASADIYIRPFIQLAREKAE